MEMQASPSAQGAPSRPMAASGTLTSERIIGPHGDIVIQFGGKPSWESYDFLENYIKLRKGVLKPGSASEGAQEKERD